MRIAISMRGLQQGSFAISNIINQLSRAIIKLSKDNHEIFLYFNDSEFKTLFNNKVIKRSANIKNRFLWDHLWLPFAIKKDNIDYALFFKGTVPPLINCRMGVLFHDLGYFDDQLNPYKKLETIYMKFMMKKTVDKSQHVFTVSQFTKNEIEKILNVNPNKIFVCYSNCSSDLKNEFSIHQLEENKVKYQLPEKFIFWPTSISPRKNISRTLDAFRKISAKIPHHLVITGGKYWNSNSDIRRLKNDISKNVSILGNVPEEDIPLLYKNSSFTIYPSLLEGFGIPILEAFNSGSPILTSNISSMPEVASGAAMLVDPYNIDEIANGIYKLATEENFRKNLIKKGFKRAEFFSWNKTAKIILDQIEC